VCALVQYSIEWNSSTLIATSTAATAQAIPQYIAHRTGLTEYIRMMGNRLKNTQRERERERETFQKCRHMKPVTTILQHQS
jgi:hypothetical protein